MRFSNMCGAQIPKWLQQRLADYADDEASLHDFGADVVARLCERLQGLNAPSLHFYTLNKTQVLEMILARQPSLCAAAV